MLPVPGLRASKAVLVRPSFSGSLAGRLKRSPSWTTRSLRLEPTATRGSSPTPSTWPASPTKHADPVRALDWFHQALTYAVDHGSPFWEAVAAQGAAPVEMLYGDAHHALDLYDRALESFHQCGNVVAAYQMINSLAAALHHLQQSDTAAILLGAAAQHLSAPSDEVKSGLTRTSSSGSALRSAMRPTSINSPSANAWTSPKRRASPATTSPPLDTNSTPANRSALSGAC